MIKSSQCVLYLGLAGSLIVSVALPSQANPPGGKDFTSALSVISSFSSGGSSSSVTATSSATATSFGDSGFSSSQSTSSAFSSSAGSGSSSATATSPTGTPSSQSATVFTPGATSSSASATAAASTTSPNITSVTVAAPATSTNPTSVTFPTPATSANPNSANITSANITSAKVNAPATIIPNAAGISTTLPVATFSNPNVPGTSRSSTVAATYISNFSLLSSLPDKSEIIEQRKDLSVENNSSNNEGASYSLVGLGSRVFPGLGLRLVTD